MSKSNTSGPRTSGGSSSQNPNYPRTTGNPSGGDRGNTPKK